MSLVALSFSKSSAPRVFKSYVSQKLNSLVLRVSVNPEKILYIIDFIREP